MKIKPIDDESLNEEVRYNPKIQGTHLFIQKSEYLNNKKAEYSLMVLLTLMYQNGYFDLIDCKKERFNELINNSRRIIGSNAFSTSSVFAQNDIIKFTNGDYLIIDSFKYNNIDYLFLINNGVLNDTSIKKVINNNSILQYFNIEDDNEYKFILNKLFLKFKDEYIKYLNEE